MYSIGDKSRMEQRKQSKTRELEESVSKWITLKCKLCNAYRRFQVNKSFNFEELDKYIHSRSGWCWTLEHGWICKNCNN